MFYFAYGANLNLENMKHRCPNAKPIVKFSMPNYRLVFKGVADIEYSANETVEGMLWEITDKCEQALDIFEGYPHLYRKEYFTIKMSGKLAHDFGENADVMFYAMNSTNYGEPNQSYFNCILDGYIANKLDTDFLYDALLHAQENHSLYRYESKSWK